MSSKCRGEISPVMSPALGNRIGIATWTYNAQPALLKNSTRSRPQGRNTDYMTERIPRPMVVSCPQSGPRLLFFKWKIRTAKLPQD
jgi:hypothetical protein